MTNRIDGRWVLSLADFFGGAAAEASATLARLAEARRWPGRPDGMTRVGFDATSWATLRDHLATVGILDARGVVAPEIAEAAAVAVEVATDAVAAAIARLPAPMSRLVVTATASEDLASVRNALGVPPIYELIERTVRTAKRSVTLGAPFWNEAATAALTPALEGALQRGCEAHLVLQGGQRRPSTALAGIGQWAEHLRGSGRVTVWHFDADDLSDRHIALHAKFVLADEQAGYLGSANLTDYGFEVNLEIGVALGPAEVCQVHALLDELRVARVLTAQ